jgi:hypothetical protein
MPKPSLSPFLLDPNAEPEAQPPAANQNTPPRTGTELDAAESFVISALRGWIAPTMRPGESHPDWRDLFRLAKVGAVGMLGFDALMSVIGAQA